MQLIVGACQRLQKHRPTGAVGVPCSVFSSTTDAFHPHAHTQAASITHHVVVAKEPHPKEIGATASTFARYNGDPHQKNWHILNLQASTVKLRQAARGGPRKPSGALQSSLHMPYSRPPPAARRHLHAPAAFSCTRVSGRRRRRQAIEPIRRGVGGDAAGHAGGGGAVLYDFTDGGAADRRAGAGWSSRRTRNSAPASCPARSR